MTLELVDADRSHTLEVGFEPGEAKRIVLDGSPLDGPAGPTLVRRSACSFPSGWSW